MSLLVRIVEAHPHAFAYVTGVWGIILLWNLIGRALGALGL